MQFKKVLVPVDGSEHSNHALDYAIGMSKAYGASIALLHCVERLPMLIGGEEREQMLAEMKGEAEKEFAPFLTKLRDAGIEPEFIIRDGRPDNTIVDEAHKGEYDLILIGSRGLSDVEGAVLGSVAHRVLSAAHCPVLVVR